MTRSKNPMWVTVPYYCVAWTDGVRLKYTVNGVEVSRKARLAREKENTKRLQKSK